MRSANIGRAMAKPKPPDDGVKQRINDDVIPVTYPVRTVDNDSCVPAFYPRPDQPHSHHLQAADPEIEQAVWGWNQQARDVAAEDRNHDETIKR